MGVEDSIGRVVVLRKDCGALQVDPQRNLLYVRGMVPGHRGNFVYVKDAYAYRAGKRKHPTNALRPFPTFIGEEAAEAVVMDVGADPFMDA
jgi:large subunit ribosomal protein L3